MVARVWHKHPAIEQAGRGITVPTDSRALILSAEITKYFCNIVIASIARSLPVSTDSKDRFIPGTVHPQGDVVADNNKNEPAEQRVSLTRVWILIALFVYLLLVGVGIIGDGFKWISGGAEGAAKIFSFARNPVVGVILGTLATALVQSSSTVTSVIVGLVAGGMPVSIAVPMIMGANMGTTITNTIVSLGNFGERSMFNKSFQAATVHDFFNLYSIVIFLPIEMIFHPLERLAGVMADWFVGGTSASVSDLNVIGAITKPVAKFVVGSLQFMPTTIGALLAIAIGIGFVIASVLYLGKLLRSVMTGKAMEIVHDAVGGGPWRGIATGTVVTVLVQSSSTTTSLIVPLAGAGALTTRQVFPFTMGANIGTCITALLAATSVSGPTQVFALQIALVHLMYNVFGVLVFLYTPWLRELPVKSAKWLGDKVEVNRGWAFGYIGTVFFLMPGVVFAGEALLGEPQEDIVAAKEADGIVEEVQEEIEEAQLEIE
jgi:sodium-dependent phosphate cotransporter